MKNHRVFLLGLDISSRISLLLSCIVMIVLLNS